MSNGFTIECCDNARQHPAWLELYIGYPETVGGTIPCQKGCGRGVDINSAFLKKSSVLHNWVV